MKVLATNGSALFVQRFDLDKNTMIRIHDLKEEQCDATVGFGSEGTELIELFGNRLYPSKVSATEPIEIGGYAFRPSPPASGQA